MPAQTKAWSLFGDGKRQPSVLPAGEVKTAQTQAIADSTGSADMSLKRKVDRSHAYEIESERTPFTSTYVNKDGTKSLEYSFSQQNYKVGSKWEKIDNTLTGITDSPVKSLDTLGSLTGSAPDPNTPSKFIGKSGKLNTRMNSLAQGIDFTIGGKTFNMSPIGVNDVRPTQRDDHTIVYKNAWKGVDLEYELRGETIKETIVVNKKIANPSFDFKITGGKVIPHPTKPGLLTIEGLSEDFNFSPLSVDVNNQGVISEERATQTATAAGINIRLDKQWFNTLNAEDFPVRIDPTFGEQPASQWWMYKSDGYYCGPAQCYANTGSLNSSGWKHWRTYFQIPYLSSLAGKKILDAKMHGYYKTGIGGTGVGYPRYLGHANCLGFNCLGTYVGEQQGVGGDFDIYYNRDHLQSVINAGDWGAVWSLWGNECGCLTYKPYWDVRATIWYDTPTPETSPVEPADTQVTVNTQPTLRVNPVNDPDGDAVQYYFRISTGQDAETGAVINSGWIGSTQWTVPDGILQDGTTYYWHVYTRGATDPTAAPSWKRSFTIDLRTGKDNTQSYDTVGPVGTDLATGKATTSASTHSMNALGGSIGLNFDYDSPAKSKKGLIGEYWNVAANYNFAGGAPTGSPNLTRNDADVNFDWNTSNPSPGVINDDWFYARWKGYFVAPTTGSYTFGSAVDDNVEVYVNEQKVFGRNCCSGAVDYAGATPVTLQEGQAVPIRINYLEAVGAAYAKVFVKGAVAEQPISREWLRTEVKATPSQYGLVGRYYTDDGSHTYPGNDADPMRLMMARTDNVLSFNWGSGGPAPYLQSDNFMVKWTGYITVPASGNYKFGATTDDGVRIKLNNGILGSQNTYLDSWQDQAATVWGSNTAALEAGKAVPITVEYFEHGGGAQFSLLIQKDSDASQPIPVTWLTPKVVALPDAWRLGVDVDGDVSYERLRVVGQNVILEDSTRSTHEYTYKDGGFKPPVNEDGQLTRNTNNTYTLLDSDGKTYVFDAEGKLLSVTSATDDRNPAAIRYVYSDSPARLKYIVDGVTVAATADLSNVPSISSARYAVLNYKNINEDGNCSIPSGFDAAPDGMLCAFKTSDGDITKLYYKSGQLSRIEKPGGELTDFSYDTTGLGRISSIRDSMANDAIVAGIRSDDASAMTELTYDSIGRINTIKAPAPTAGANRMSHGFEYLTNATQMHVTGASEPNGFSKRIEYDNLLRTTKEVSLTNLASLTEWDPVKDLELSKTDPTGMKSTSIYDDEDHVIESYGPAPSSWFGSDRKPTNVSPTYYANQTPKTTTAYDENIVGPEVTYYNYKSDNKTLVGTPKLRSNGLTDSTGTTSTPAVLERTWGSSLPITPDSGMNGWGFRATGKIRVQATGNYTFHFWHDDGIRVRLDDTLLAEDWNNGANRRTDGSRTLEAGKVYRLLIEYYDTDSNGAVGFYMSNVNAQPVNADKDWSAELKPGFGLKTSETTYDSDSQLGNLTTTTSYAKPQYGLADKTTIDPTGLNLQTTSVYETPGATGSFLRQTSKTLPGGGTTAYQHYSANEIKDNPCTTQVESYHQAGQQKGKVESDPDGAGTQVSRTSETIYNESGDVVATRYNNDDWTCTEYDSRGRVTRTVVPANGSKPGRTITNDYAKDGNPLVTTTTDNQGTIRVENDLLGRTTKYIDTSGKVTTNVYDDYGKLTSRTSPIGTETFLYDNFDRLTTQKLDGVTFATVTYDTYSRIASVQYPAGFSLSGITRDTLGRENGTTYTLADSQTLSDQVTRYVSGDIKNGTELGVSKSYSYNKAGRLTGATLGNNTYSYDFGAQDASCPIYAGYDAGKNGNRTKLTVNGQVTTYCYDAADKLISSSDPTLTNAQYDAHGNTTSLGDASHQTAFSYDVSDRNTGIASGTKETAFVRDAQNRVVTRTHKEGGTVTGNVNYGFTGAGDTPDFLLDGNGDVIQKYVTLPGDVLVTIKTNSQSAGATTFSLPNIHGDVMATVNADGALLSTFMTGPFGEVLPNQLTQPTNAIAPMSNPTNTADGTTYQYVGQHEKLTDLDTSPIAGGITQMGARVYIPTLGRFLSVDSVEGGTENNYVYSNDPIGSPDLDGKLIPLLIMGALYAANLAWSAYEAKKDPSPTNMTFLALAVIPGGGSLGVKAGSKAALIASNAARGAKVERAVATAVRVTHPFHKVETARKATGFHADKLGMRYSDIIATNRFTGKVTRYEVKSGGARYNAAQKAKDQWIKSSPLNQKTKCIRISARSLRC